MRVKDKTQNVYIAKNVQHIALHNERYAMEEWRIEEPVGQKPGEGKNGGGGQKTERERERGRGSLEAQEEKDWGQQKCPKGISRWKPASCGV